MSDKLVMEYASAVIFFADSCEIAAYSVTANPVTDESKEEAGMDDIGAVISIGTGIERATWIGNADPGSANANSFEGIFHTGDVNFTAVGILIGASLYFGDYSDKFGGFWVGGVLGVGAGLGGVLVDWDYKIMGSSIKLDDGHTKIGNIFGKCICEELIRKMPL